MEGVAGSTTAADAEDPEDPPHPLVNASVIAANTTVITNSQHRALCNFGAQAERPLICNRKQVLKCEKDSILEPVVTAATFRLAHICTTLMRTMRVLAPVRENLRNFIDTPFLNARQTKFTSTIVEPQQRNIPRQNRQVEVPSIDQPPPPQGHAFPCFALRFVS
jgi:hypothetical protein